MGDSGKGIVVASVILGASIIISTVLVLGAAKQFKDEALSYAARQKHELIDMMRAQKHALQRFEWNREVRMRNFIREEVLKKMNMQVEMKASAQ